MIVYQSTKDSFAEDVDTGRIEEIISEKYVARLQRRVSPREKQSWSESLMHMKNVLHDPHIPEDAGVSVEMQIPQTSKRIDFIISGQDEHEADHAVIVELKQWQQAELTNLDGVVRTALGGGLREVSHPSYQAWSYAALLSDFNEAVHNGQINLWPCSYLHNYKQRNVLDHPFYHEHLARAPVFKKTDINNLREFIKRFVKYGDKSEIIYRIEQGRIRPSRMLVESLQSMLRGNEEFTMIDDQKVAYENVRNAILQGEPDQKKVIIIEGGPGSGKSVISINLLVSLTAHNKFVTYVTKNSAPREVYSSLLSGQMKKTRIDNLFRSSGAFVNEEPDRYDALIVDEAHRLNEKSGMFRNQGENQIKELIRASKVAVFFIDEDQRIHMHDIGDKEEIRKWALAEGAEIVEKELASQFRYSGSGGYLAWLDHVLQIRETANTELTDLDYDFRVFSSPNEMFQQVKERNKVNNKSRVVAGYCWDWASKKDSSKMDIVIPEHGFARQWNLADDGMLWMIKPESIEEIGCIHTCQGLELDYVGVIIGPDLKVRDGQVITDPFERSKNDRSIFGLKKMMKERPEEARKKAEMIIKNTYRTLLSRGRKGCFIYCTDKETEEYFRQMVSGEVDF